MTRQVIVVDIETNQLLQKPKPMEVAAINLNTGEEFYFVPWLHSTTIEYADPEALAINRYYERGVFRYAEKGLESSNEKFRHLLHVILKGNTFAGSNPSFDAGVLVNHMNIHDDPPWHHRLGDLSVYAAGVLGLPLGELPGLHEVCQRLDIVNDEPHGALSDARATAACFRSLMAMKAPGRLVEDWHGKAVSSA